MRISDEQLLQQQKLVLKLRIKKKLLLWKVLLEILPFRKERETLRGLFKGFLS